MAWTWPTSSAGTTAVTRSNGATKSAPTTSRQTGMLWQTTPAS
ncbi:MAG: hypothetical protein WCP35_12125 [Verrucomicrobiota bacterium]